MAQDYPYVVVDSAALLDGPEAAALVGALRDTILVVAAGVVKRRQVDGAVSAVEAAFGRLRGVVVNHLAPGGGRDR
jgi:NAD(P)-dependent dehydrogenase (short-subunit alcohol dehydrogenase family)